MRNVDADFKSKYKDSNSFVKSQMFITVNDGDTMICNSDIVSQSMKLSQSICDSDEFRFGGCIACQFEIETSNTAVKKGDKIKVKLEQEVNYLLYPQNDLYPSDTLYPGFQKSFDNNNDLFCGNVYSSVYSKNRTTKKIVAYDAFYWIGSVDCSAWYKKLYDDYAVDGYLKIGKIRSALLEKFFKNSYEEVNLPADELKVKKVSGKVTVLDLLRQICEINGVFAFIKGNGIVSFIEIKNTVSDEHPQYEHYNYCIDIEIEDFETDVYGGFYIMGFQNGNGFYDFSSSSNENYYPIDDIPIITENETTQDFGQEWSNLNKSGYNGVLGEKFTPFSMKSVYRGWVEIGDQIRVDYRIGNDKGYFDSYILNRTLSGFPAIRDEISASGGAEAYTEDDFNQQE